MPFGLVLLAAGASTRLGSPKQLLPWGGESLLRHAARTALGSVFRPVIVVLGAGAEALQAELTGLDVTIAVNPDWSRGMGGSLCVGLQALLESCGDQSPDGALVMLCDQPLVTAAMLDALAAGSGPGSLVAASYGGDVGVPTLFGRDYFAELLALPDAAGAKKLLHVHRARVIEIPLPEAVADIDTREQYEKLTAPQALPNPR